MDKIFGKEEILPEDMSTCEYDGNIYGAPVKEELLPRDDMFSIGESSLMDISIKQEIKIEPFEVGKENETDAAAKSQVDSDQNSASIAGDGVAAVKEKPADDTENQISRSDISEVAFKEELYSEDDNSSMDEQEAYEDITIKNEKIEPFSWDANSHNKLSNSHDEKMSHTAIKSISHEEQETSTSAQVQSFVLRKSRCSQRRVARNKNHKSLADTDDPDDPDQPEETEEDDSSDERSLELESKSTNSDSTLYCSECKRLWDGDCPKHGPLIIVKDTVVPIDVEDSERAVKTAPPQVSVAETSESGKSVFAKEPLPSRMRFGPIQGKVVDPKTSTAFTWLICKLGKPYMCIDTTEPRTSNWMRFVKVAQTDTTKNCDVFQYQGKFYFKTIRDISPGEELFIGAYDHYGHLTKFDPELYKTSKEFTLGVQKKIRYLKGDTKKQKRFRCKECNKELSTQAGLLEHMCAHAHRDENPFQCFQCNKTFARKQNVQVHGRIRPFECIQCNKRFTSEAYLRIHDRIHTGEKPFECSQCNKRFSQKINLQTHEKIHTGEKPFECTQCNKKFRRKVSFRRLERIHTGEEPFKCTKCSKTFRQKVNFQKQERLHTGEQQFECIQCNKPFTSAANLRIHSRIHTGAKPFECTQCNKTFSQKSNLQTHEKIHTLEKPFECTRCNKTFRHINSFRRHERIHTGENPFQCPHCNKTYRDKVSLQTHERIHTGEHPFECIQFNKIFTRRANLRIHCRIHTGEKPFECTHCNKTFRYINNFRRHERIHTGEKPFECIQCNKIFTCEAYLRIHDSIHTGVKPFQCVQCNKTFTQKNNLKTHERIHTGVKPFKCTQCNKAFRHINSFRRHEIIHTGEKPFQCTHFQCNKKFRHKDSLRTHERIHTGGEPFESIQCN